MKISKEKLVELLEWALVIFVVFYMSVYGFGKYIQFDEISNYKESVDQLKPMQLMWAFYSYSKTYVVILGIFEIIGSLLFLLPKTRIIGGFLLSGILINVILQDYFYEVHSGALIGAIFYQVSIFIVLFLNRKPMIEGIKSFVVSKKTSFEGNKILSIAIISIFLIIIYFLNYLLVKLF